MPSLFRSKVWCLARRGGATPHLLLGLLSLSIFLPGWFLWERKEWRKQYMDLHSQVKQSESASISSVPCTHIDGSSQVSATMTYPVAFTEEPADSLEALREQVAALGKELGRIKQHLEERSGAKEDNRRLADTALGLAEKALSNGEHKLAAVYFLNSIGRCPEEAKYVLAYTDMLISRKETTFEDLEGATTALAAATYQVQPLDVPKVLTRLEQVEKLKEKLLASVKNDPPAEEPDWKARVARLKMLDRERLTDLSRLEEHLNEIQELQEAIPPADLLWRDLQTEAAHIRELAQVVEKCQYIDRCIEQLAAQDSLTSELAVALIQSAENVLPTLWGISRDSLPQSIRVKVDGYPKLIQDWVDRIAHARSAPLLEKIRELQTLVQQPPETEVKEEDPWEKQCQYIERQIREAKQLASQMTSPELLGKAQEELEQMQQKLLADRRRQYDRYQRFALNRLREAMKAFNGQWNVDEDDAWEILFDNKLDEIDASLLSTEVGRCYNDVVGKLLHEMGPNKCAEAYMYIGQKAKRKMEQF